MDEDTQTSLLMENKSDVKESDSSTCFIKTESAGGSANETERCFKFEDQNLLGKEELKETATDVDGGVKEKESEPPSVLWCEETIPGSPTPMPTSEPKQKVKNEPEMPFASAPCSSSNKPILENEHMHTNREVSPTPPPENSSDPSEIRDTSAVMDNTPPTTPESTLSNLSPRG